MSVLEVRGLTVRFGGVVAVDGVDLTVASGEVVGLIGPNGSGKTSLLDALSGLEPSTGSVRLGGEPIDGLAAHRRAARGLSRTFQSLDLFTDLSVEENLRIAARDEDASVTLARVGLALTLEQRVSALDTTQQRLLALACALADTPQVVLLDEVAAGLDRAARATVMRSVQDAAARGAAVVVVEHDFDLVLAVADRVVVLHGGRVLASGPPADVRSNADVIAAYLGAVS